MRTKIFLLLARLFILVLLTPVFAATPLFTLTPLTSTNIQVASNETATVQYIVQNQSSKKHTLVMKPITGITQVTSSGNCGNPFILNGKALCTLTLQINGNQLSNNIVGGPLVCQQSANGQPNPMLCYQPNNTNALHISLTSPLVFYVGTQNGNVYYSLTNGLTWIMATLPAGGSAINSIFVTSNVIYAASANGSIYYSTNAGVSWIALTPPDGSAVNSVFFAGGVLYASTANGYIYYSFNNGITWQNTTPPDGSSITAIFVTPTSIYAGTINGFIYYSPNNGNTWISINGQPDGFSIRSIFIANNTLYVSTTKEFVYSSTALTGGGTWKHIAQTVYSLFVNSTGTALYAGTQSGYVFSLTTGSELGFVNYSPINALFVVN